MSLAKFLAKFGEGAKRFKNPAEALAGMAGNFAEKAPIRRFTMAGKNYSPQHINQILRSEGISPSGVGSVLDKEMARSFDIKRRARGDADRIRKIEQFSKDNPYFANAILADVGLVGATGLQLAMQDEQEEEPDEDFISKLKNKFGRGQKP